MDWLTTHSDALTVVAALVSGLAAAVVAVFSIVSWKLYRLEKSRTAMKVGRFAADIRRAAVEAQSMAKIAQMKLDKHLGGTGWVDPVEGSLEFFRPRLHVPLNASREAPLESLAFIHTAELMYTNVRVLIERHRGGALTQAIRDEIGGGPWITPQGSLMRLRLGSPSKLGR